MASKDIDKRRRKVLNISALTVDSLFMSYAVKSMAKKVMGQVFSVTTAAYEPASILDYNRTYV